MRIHSKQRATEFCLLICQDHPGAAAPSRQCSHQTSWPSAHHQYITMLVDLVVAFRVRQLRRMPQPRCLADIVFVALPHRPWPHEGFVIKTRWQQSPDQTVKRIEVEMQTGPAVYRSRNQPLVELDLGSPLVGHRICSLAKLDDGIRLFRTGTDESARAVILDTTSK